MAHRRFYWTRLPALLLAAVLLSGTAAMAAQSETSPSSAAIYTTGDMFGKLYEEDPITGQDKPDNYLKVATAMTQERELMESTLLLDSGDACYTGLTGDDGQAVAQALRRIGYNALVPGVEEFRLGANHCQDFFQALKRDEGPGTPVDVLSANLLDSDEVPVATPYQVYTLTLDGQEVRVGVLGLGGIDTADQLPNRLYGDLLFAHKENEENSYIWEWNYWQPRLEQEDCDLVVVVCHAGKADLTDFAQNTTGIDLVVGGHGQAMSEQVTNPDGETVSLVSGGGTCLTRTTIVRDEEGTPVISSSTLLSLESYEADETLSRWSAVHASELKEAANQKVGILSGDWQDERSFTRQTDTVDLVGEALLWATDADAVLLSPGSLGSVTAASLFERKATTAGLTLADCGQIAPDLSPVVAVELTGAQLRQWLEVCAGRYSVNDAGQPIGGQGADVLYGMDYELDLGSAEGQRAILLRHGEELIPDGESYTVALPASRLDDPEFPDCTVLWDASAHRDFAARGGSTASLLAAYAQSLARQNRTITPTRSSTWAVYPEAFNASLTRLEFVELLYDLAGRPQPGANYAFIDVTGSDAVIWAAESRVVTGDGKGRFLPLTIVNREQAAVMLYNYVRSLDRELPDFEGASRQLLDAGSISEWAIPAVEFCITTGILPAAGVRNDLYLPGSAITRSDARTYLANLEAYLEA